MAAVQRGECQRWALDQKKTCFGVSLDGEAAFPSVEREIQVRELYSVGERGDLLKYSKNTYINTECVIQQSGLLSRRFREYKGNRQGHVRASGHYKAYINPCLLSLNRTDLGFHIGPICITAVSEADDTYLLSDSKSGLQGALNIINNYGKKYRVIFNAEKTKLVVTGSKQDMTYYQDVGTWMLDNKKIAVTNENEHLGLIVSGLNEEQKNIDANINACRKSILGMLGPCYAFKTLLSPTVQLHLWRVYNLPVLCSGLAALPIRPSIINQLKVFHNRIMRSFLKLSDSSPVPALHFLLGELPIQGRLHLQLLSLFYNIWSSPNTTIYKIVLYLLKMAGPKSHTWTAHLRHTCLLYRLPDPLALLQCGQVWKKSSWKTLTKTRVTVHYENILREEALKNSKMKYLNVEVQGLSGVPHPALLNIENAQEVKKLRAHIKLLSGDFLTAERLNLDNGKSPQCRLCLSAVESVAHVVTQCRATSDICSRMLPELLNTVLVADPSCSILDVPNQTKYLTQFILDCTSLNLPAACRIAAHNPRISQIFAVSRNWCHAISRERARLLCQLKPS